MSWRHGWPVEVLAEAQDPIVQILVHPFSYRADLTSDREVLLWFLRDKVTELLELNVAQNRVLREEELGLEDVAAFLLERRA